MQKKPKTRPVPVRLDEALHQRLRKAARRLGATDSAMIRFAIINQLPHVEAGRITITPDAPE